MTFEFALTAFAAVFAVVNPIGNIPLFVAVTEGYSRDLRQRIIVKIVIVIVGVLVAFALFGQYIFALYGITIPAFKIAGGLLLFAISFSMVQGQRTRTKITEEDEQDLLAKEEIGIVPLGIPLFAGPGAITTVMIYTSYATSAGDWSEFIEVIIAILATAAISYLLLVYSTPIFDRMGRMGAAAFSRIMGLLLAAVAIQFIISGIIQVVQSYPNII